MSERALPISIEQYEEQYETQATPRRAGSRSAEDDAEGRGHGGRGRSQAVSEFDGVVASPASPPPSAVPAAWDWSGSSSHILRTSSGDPHADGGEGGGGANASGLHGMPRGMRSGSGAGSDSDSDGSIDYEAAVEGDGLPRLVDAVGAALKWFERRTEEEGHTRLELETKVSLESEDTEGTYTTIVPTLVLVCELTSYFPSAIHP